MTLSPETIFGLIAAFAAFAAILLTFIALDADFCATRRARPARRIKRRAFGSPDFF